MNDYDLFQSEPNNRFINHAVLSVEVLIAHCLHAYE